jgi:hypothetical protein
LASTYIVLIKLPVFCHGSIQDLTITRSSPAPDQLVFRLQDVT